MCQGYSEEQGYLSSQHSAPEITVISVKQPRFDIQANARHLQTALVVCTNKPRVYYELSVATAHFARLHSRTSAAKRSRLRGHAWFLLDGEVLRQQQSGLADSQSFRRCPPHVHSGPLWSARVPIPESNGPLLCYWDTSMPCVNA